MVELCLQRPEKKKSDQRIVLFNRSKMIKCNQYELFYAYHISDCFIMIADLLIFSFFKGADKIPSLASML